MSKIINTFDIDGVIFMGVGVGGVYPGPNDFIITGRSYEEAGYTLEMLRDKGINNYVFFNPLPYEQKGRESSGIHKAKIIKSLQDQGYTINVHFEDDRIQANEITKACKDVTVVILEHDLVKKENCKHTSW